MDLSAVLRSYIERMLREVGGMKVLLLDAETTAIVSTVYSQSEILEKEVFLVQRLDIDRGEQLFHLKVGRAFTTTCWLAWMVALPNEKGVHSATRVVQQTVVPLLLMN